MSSVEGGGQARLREMLERALAFTEKLLAENSRLRKALAASHAGGSGEMLLVSKLEQSEAEVARLRAQQAESAAASAAPEEASRRAALEHELADLRGRHALLEQQNNNLANLYVASHQLHSTLDFKEVVAIVMEIVVNLVGAESFALLLLDQKSGELKAIAAEGIDASALAATRLGEGAIGEATRAGRSHFASDAPTGAPDPARPLAVIPLRLKDDVIGCIAVFGLLPQKKGGFSPLDHQLFELLAAHAATAIFAAKLHGDSERRLSTIQGFLDMLTAS